VDPEHVILKSSFKHEFNDGGTWRPCLIVDAHDFSNAFVAFFSTDDGTWHTASAPRGEDSGFFRDRA
jgi:hypothetical protein